MIEKTFPLLLLALFFNCTNSKLVQSDTSSFENLNASFCKIIPGQEHLEISIKLTFIFEGKEQSLKVDSVLFKGTVEVPRIRRTDGKESFTVEVNESDVKENKFKLAEVKANEAILFYTLNNKESFFHLRNIKKTEDIVLP